MPRNCKCGGELVGQPGWLERCSDKKRFATFKCSNCGVVRQQGLRKATPKATAAA